MAWHSQSSWSAFPTIDWCLFSSWNIDIIDEHSYLGFVLHFGSFPCCFCCQVSHSKAVWPWLKSQGCLAIAASKKAATSHGVSSQTIYSGNHPSFARNLGVLGAWCLAPWIVAYESCGPLRISQFLPDAGVQDEGVLSILTCTGSFSVGFIYSYLFCERFM